jgi:ribosomal protein S18 acetylase RimI-like enzyme
MKNLLRNVDQIEFDTLLDDLRWRYENGLITSSGYTYETIQRLEITDIHLDWLARRMGIPRETLRSAIKLLKERSLIENQLVRKDKVC